MLTISVVPNVATTTAPTTTMTPFLGRSPPVREIGCPRRFFFVPKKIPKYVQEPIFMYGQNWGQKISYGAAYLEHDNYFVVHKSRKWTKTMQADLVDFEIFRENNPKSGIHTSEHLATRDVILVASY